MTEVPMIKKSVKWFTLQINLTGFYLIGTSVKKEWDVGKHI